MELSTGLVLKCLGGLGVASLGSVGIYYINDHVQSALTRFDKGLIEYLDGDKNDIVFTVKHGNSDLNGSFPTTFTDNNLNITVEVSATTDGETNLKGTENTEAKKKLQKLNAAASGNEGATWTWVCEMKFSKEKNESLNDINDDQKDRIFKTTNDGLLGKLKKDVSTSDAAEKKKIKDIKRSFIEKCALARTRSKNKELNGKKSLPTDDAKVKTPAENIKFELKKGAENAKWGTDTAKLFVVDKNDFDYWFPEEPKPAETGTSGS